MYIHAYGTLGAHNINEQVTPRDVWKIYHQLTQYDHNWKYGLDTIVGTSTLVLALVH